MRIVDVETQQAARPITLDPVQELDLLKRERQHVTRRIRALTFATRSRRPSAPRPTHNCLRCGYIWLGYPSRPKPLHCSRCHTAAWNVPPTKRSRKPSDPPNPKWLIDKRCRPERNARVAQETPRVEKVGEVTVMPPPPRVQSVGLPPPPRLAGVETLSERFARARLEPPQPETVASQAAAPVQAAVPISAQESDDGPAA